MSNLPLTPSSDPSPDLPPQTQQPSVDFSPATVPYNEAFENELMNLILHPPENPQIPTPSSEIPMIPASQLPIPLSSNFRTYPSPILGLNLTHPNGYHTGGPGPSPQTIEAFAQKLARERDIHDPDQLQQMIQAKISELRNRMLEREKAVQKNKEIEEQLEKLRLQREAEGRNIPVEVVLVIKDDAKRGKKTKKIVNRRVDRKTRRATEVSRPGTTRAWKHKLDKARQQRAREATKLRRMKHLGSINLAK